MADTDAAAAPAPTRPTKPDEALFKENLAKAEKEHTQIMTQYNAIKQKIELTQSNKNSENPTAKRRSELQEQLKEIRSKQGVGKNSRISKQDEIKRLDEQIQACKKEMKPVPDPLTNDDKKLLKTVDDIDRVTEIIQGQIEGGKLRLVQENEYIKNVLPRLGKSRKLFNDNQVKVDNLREKIQEIKDSLNNPEAKELSEKYTELQNELDAIKAEQDEAYKGLSSLRDERTKLQAQQREKFETIRKIKDEYYGQRKAFQAYDREQKQKAWERSRAERERIEKERKLERAQKMLAEASDPAYLDEIRRANSLLQYFDPSFVAEKAPLQASTNLQAQAERKVDGSDLKGVKILSKKDRDEDFFPAQKKGKKGKKHNAAATKTTFNVPPAVLEDCSFMGIDPPMSADEVPGVVEKVKAKLDQWKSDQASQTQKNIEKAKKEIEKIESEEAKEKEGKKSPSAIAMPNGNGATANGESADDKVAEVTKEVEDASIEEKEEEAVAAA
ncbi:hypothetical protein N8I77_000394 [Diaporthe amygdali]|uniref:Nuclear segregation protein n=1 Tax=Phomopsis amygdali TaxID=1214568 RepID=A0AAD9SPH4_PHOAM|nr:hypothetical protein N8I77_000394 [Diaporthe amygdali]